MVKKILNFLNKEINSLHEAAYLLGISAFLSQILGLIRDRILASEFGAGRELDIYYVAFKIPDFIFVSVASLVSVSVLVPFFVKALGKGKDEGKQFINLVFSFFSVFIVGVSALFFVIVPFLVPILFPGISDEVSRNELIVLSRILLLSPIFLGLSNFLSSITQVYKRFFTYALSPIVYNLGIIVGAAFLAPIYGIKGVVYGVLIGSFLHFIIQVPGVFKEGLWPRFYWKINFLDIKEVILLSFPRTIALALNYISVIVLLALASLMNTGSISVFNFAFNLQAVPATIIGVSYSVAAFPILSRLYSEGNTEKFLAQIISAMQHIIFWSFPVTALFIVLRAQVVRTILGAGQFSWSDTRLTAAVLALFAISAVAQGLILLFVRAYYAAQNTKKPLFINLFSSIVIILVAYCSVLLFKHSPTFVSFIEYMFRVQGIEGTEVLALPLGYSFGILLNAVILWKVFEKSFIPLWTHVSKTFFHSLFSAFTIGIVSYWFLNIFDTVFNLETLLGIFLQGFISGIIGICAGIGVLVVCKNEEIAQVWKTLHTKVWKQKIAPPPQEQLEL